MAFGGDEMDLSLLSDLELEVGGFRSALSERSSLLSVLEFIAEVDRRKSFSPSYKSLQAFVMKVYGYGDRSARKRIKAMSGDGTSSRY